MTAATPILDNPHLFEGLEHLLHYSSLAKKHPLGATLGAVGLVASYVLYKTIRQSRVLCMLPGPAPASDLIGHIPEIFDAKTGIAFQERIVKTYGATCRLKGFLGEDQLWTADPRAIHEMITKDCDNFQGSVTFFTWVILIGGRNILTAQGEKHKLQRKLLNPVFTVAHIRELVPTFATIADQVVNGIQTELGQIGSNGTVDVYKWMNCAAIEMIGQAGKFCFARFTLQFTRSSGLGYSFGMIEGKESKYLDASSRLFPSMLKMWYMDPVLKHLVKLGPRGFRRFFVDHAPFSHVQELKDIVDTMNDVAKGIYKQKEEAFANGTLHEQVAAGKDIMTALMKQNEVLPPHERMTKEEVISQVFGFMFAGSDTTSTSLAQTIELLAHHAEIQSTLRAEIREAYNRYGPHLDYDQINSLTFLDAVCRESLRLCSPTLGIERTVQKDSSVPLQYPVKSSDGKRMITHVDVKKGTNIFISIHAANRDKQTWGEDAEDFNPSRWLSDLPSSVKGSTNPGVYSSMMTFWGGPRFCIGFKFALLEIKMVLARVIGEFKFEIGDEKIMWNAGGSLRPHVVNDDGTWSDTSLMPMKVTLVDDDL